MSEPTRIPLILSPTPVHRLAGISRQLGADLWIKRDDLTGFALGGNKGRKLEYLIADALAQGAEVAVTCGAAQSNFIRQLGAACSMFGVRCAAAVMKMPFDVEAPPASSHSESDGGNVLLDRLLAVDLQCHPDGTWEELYALAEELAQSYERRGLKVYRIPVGGSCPLGAYAFYKAAAELDQPFDAIVFASSSGSTHTGLASAFAGTKTLVLGIACDPEPEIAEDFAVLAAGLKEIVPSAPLLTPSDYELDFRFVGPGYGIPSMGGNVALERLARSDGVFLDPIYTGKAFAGLLALLADGSVSGRILFWHTGGIPALFA